MTAVATTRSMVTSARGRAMTALAAGVLCFVAAGCGNDESSTGTTTGTTSVASAVEQALYREANTQEIACESLGRILVGGVSREVARCSFTQEENDAGEMRARGGCFVLENGSALDVTTDVPADVTCFTKT